MSNGTELLLINSPKLGKKFSASHSVGFIGKAVKSGLFINEDLMIKNNRQLLSHIYEHDTNSLTTA